jgi:hypothetical protein
MPSRFYQRSQRKGTQNGTGLAEAAVSWLMEAGVFAVTGVALETLAAARPAKTIRRARTRMASFIMVTP